jgi:hypothetical protein
VGSAIALFVMGPGARPVGACCTAKVELAWRGAPLQPCRQSVAADNRNEIGPAHVGWVERLICRWDWYELGDSDVRSLSIAAMVGNDASVLQQDATVHAARDVEIVGDCYHCLAALVHQVA